MWQRRKAPWWSVGLRILWPQGWHPCYPHRHAISAPDRQAHEGSSHPALCPIWCIQVQHLSTSPHHPPYDFCTVLQIVCRLPDMCWYVVQKIRWHHEEVPSLWHWQGSSREHVFAWTGWLPPGHPAPALWASGSVRSWRWWELWRVNYCTWWVPCRSVTNQ